MNKKNLLRIGTVAAAALVLTGVVVTQSMAITPKQELGKRLFFDNSLSNPPGQACASCHAPEMGFTGPDSAINEAGAVYPGSDPTLFGKRKPPTVAYASYRRLWRSPVRGVWRDGVFWDGHAAPRLSDVLGDQALVAFLDPLQQNMLSPVDVCLAVQASTYADLFEAAWGPGSLDCGSAVWQTYANIALSLAAYERSPEVSAFTSKYDYYLQGQVKLTGVERKGLELFESRAGCFACHTSRSGPEDEGEGFIVARFTRYYYVNLGLPRNPMNPFYAMPPSINPKGADWIDLGLEGFLDQGMPFPQFFGLAGQFKTPTLRNVDQRPRGSLVKAYGHNGYFKSLRSFVHFINTRDVLGPCDVQKDPKEGVNCWPPPEEPRNVERNWTGNLGLREEEEEAIVEFLNTLSDGYTP